MLMKCVPCIQRNAGLPIGLHCLFRHKTRLLSSIEFYQAICYTDFESCQDQRIIDGALYQAITGLIVASESRAIEALRIIEIRKILLDVNKQVCLPQSDKAGLCLLLKIIRLFKLAEPAQIYCLVHFANGYIELNGGFVLIGYSPIDTGHTLIQLDSLLISTYTGINHSYIMLDIADPKVITEP